MNRIDSVFTHLRHGARRPALMPFLTAGDPDLPTTAALVREVVARGADLVEIGIPYSDPIADGPVIAASYTRALRKGVKLAAIFETIQQLRADPDASSLNATPLVAMVSYAIVLRHGAEAFVREAAGAGLDGLIVPDLPVEEAGPLAEWIRAHDLRLIQLVTPRTPRDRALQIAATTSGFLYYVSVAGITGERRELPPDLVDNVAWLREHTPLPIGIGFGISGPDQVRQLAPVADGLIVGSAIVRRIAEHEGQPAHALISSIGDFVAELRSVLDAGGSASTRGD